MCILWELKKTAQWTTTRFLSVAEKAYRSAQVSGDSSRSVCAVGGLRDGRFARLAFAQLAVCGLRFTRFAVCAVGGLRAWRFARMAICVLGGLRSWRFARFALGGLRLAVCALQFAVGGLRLTIGGLRFALDVYIALALDVVDVVCGLLMLSATFRFIKSLVTSIMPDFPN